MAANRKHIRFGIIGLGLIGKEFGSAVARWCHLLDDAPVPVITGICNRKNEEDRKWFLDNFQGIDVVTDDYRELIGSDKVDAVYCAVPHNLHEQIYCDIIRAGKHLFGEKPFGIDKKANQTIINVSEEHPEVIVRCTSQFPYFSGAKRVIDWIRAKKYGRVMEVRCGFLHSSDMDLDKPINWKRTVEINGEYGCMGDLGLHIQHIPFRMGWKPVSVYADLQNIAETRLNGKGERVPCKTWDNAVLTCRARDHLGNDFSLIFETKRMAPGHANTWYIEVYGTAGSVKFSTREAKAFYYLETKGKEQGWTRVDIGPESFIPSISGHIFEVGFSDAFQQMMGAFMREFKPGGSDHEFENVTLEETRLSHTVLTAALDSNKTGKRIDLEM